MQKLNQQVHQKGKVKGFRRCWKAVGILSFCFFLLLCSDIQAAEPKHVTKEKKVLFINSYGYDWESTQMQIDGVERALADQVIINYLFMDTKNIERDKAERLLYARLKEQAPPNEVYEAVILGDDAALKFALKYRNEFFTEIPLIFEGINNEELAEKAAQDEWITGITETFSMDQTIELAYRMYPDATQVVAVTDETLSGKGSTAQYYGCQQQFPELEFTELNCSALTKSEILSRVKELDEKSILLFLLFSEDVDGNLYTASEGIGMISADASIPVFRAAASYTGMGALGGRVLSFEDMGYKAGCMVRQVIAGTSVESLQPEKAETHYLFDAQVMKRFHITDRQLPENAMIINREESFYEKYSNYVHICIAICSLFIIMLLYMLYDNRKKRRLNHVLQASALSLIRNEESLKQDISEKQLRQDIFGMVAINIYELIACINGLERKLKILAVGTAEKPFDDSEERDYDAEIQTLIKKTVFSDDRQKCSQALALDAIREHLAEEQMYSVYYRTKGGKRKHPLRKKAQFFYIDRKRELICLSITDITENFEGEQQLNDRLQTALDEAHKANQAKSDFLSNMSHEIRTPMNAILGLSELSMDVLNDAEKLRSYLTEIHSSSVYLLGLIKDILDMSKIESEKVILKPEPYSTEECVNHVLTLLRESMTQKQLDFQFEAQSLTEKAIMVDRMRYEQIFMNLLSNAVKFTPAGGQIYVGVTQLSKTKKTVRSRIVVRDTGIGMSP